MISLYSRGENRPGAARQNQYEPNVQLCYTGGLPGELIKQPLGGSENDRRAHTK